MICFYCGEEATLLCDGLLGWRMLTCDRPLCENCASQVGVTFASGDDGYMETIDHCRECASTRAPLLSDEDLDAMRARRQMRLR